MALATRLPIKAVAKPTHGPRIIPSIGSKYILQLRQSSKDDKYNTECKAAKTLTSAMFFDELFIV
jgi:hypothetical protein